MRTFPTLTTGLIFLNAMVYVFCMNTGAYDTAIYKFSLMPGYFQSSAFFTSMFMHADYWHIFFNMLFFLFFGLQVEDDLGPLAFLVFYLVSGICGSAAHYYFTIVDGNGMVPTVGASGAVMGVIGGYLVLIPSNLARSFQRFGCLSKIAVFLLTPLGLKSIWGDITAVMQPPSFGEGGGGVAHWAHIGGFFGGAFLGLSMRPFLRTHKEVEAIRVAGPRKWATTGTEEDNEENQSEETEGGPIWVNWQAAERIALEGGFPPKIAELVQAQDMGQLLPLLERMLGHWVGKGDALQIKKIQHLLSVLGHKQSR